MRRHSADDCTEILQICKEVSPNEIVAASVYGSNAFGLAYGKKTVGVLLIIGSPRLVLKYHIKPLRETSLSILLVDQKTFEKDVERDWLGGLLVENMLVPYDPLVNEGFLGRQEVKAKKRIILEILGNLVLEYPEMWQELLIQPKYFMFEAMARKASLYPPMNYRFLNILGSDCGEKNEEFMMRGFGDAIEAVAEDGFLTHSAEYVKITGKYADNVQRRKLRVLNLFKTVRSSILRHSLEVFPKMMHSLLEDYWLYTKHLMNAESSIETLLPELEDPKKCIFIPTASGLVSLSDKITIEDFVKRTVPNGQNLEVDVKRLGGVLNAVYTIRLQRQDEELNVIVKVFKNWYGWKWFPLALWALGTRGFAVLGKSRLEREYAINRFLSSRGLNVPRITHVSPREGLIFQQHIEGESLTRIVKNICSSKEERASLAAVIRKVGGEIAKVHSLDVALGDCKPENIIISEDEEIYFLDLEQADKGGDKAWDIAEFLYFSGHYASLSSIEVPKTIAREFIGGYLEGGGKTENVEKARSPRYIKVFSFFTPPHILFAISSACGEKLRGNKQEKME